MQVEEQASESPNMKAQQLEEGSSEAVGNLSPSSREASTQKSSEGNALTPPNLWSDIGFYVIQLISSHLPFSKEFLGYYKALPIQTASLPYQYEG